MIVTFGCKNKILELPKKYYAFFLDASCVEDFLYEAANYGYNEAIKTYGDKVLVVRVASPYRDHCRSLNLKSIRENDKIILSEIPQENESFLDFRTRLFYYGKPIFEIKKCENI